MGAIVLALFFPKAAAIGYLVTATIAIVRAGGDDPPEETTQGPDQLGAKRVVGHQADCVSLR